MANEVFHINAVTRGLEEGVRIAEALGLPEISALADSQHGVQATLRMKAVAVLNDHSLSPPLWLYRRRLGAEVTLDETILTLDPPKRAAAWEESVALKLPFVRWVEGDLHQACVPSLGVLVLATQEALLPQKVVEHARMLLAGRRRVLSLRELASLARTQSLTLERLAVSAEVKTARQIAELGEEDEKEPSMLAKLAEELPPLVAQKPAKPPPAPPQSAFDMEAELAQLAEALTGVLRRSVLLVGPAGGGKTALVCELARRRREFGFAETPFWSTSGARLMTGQIGFGMWQDRCQQMCREASRTRAIVHLNGLGDLLEVGKTSRTEQSVGGFLRPWIARGDLTVIAECTPEQLGAIERQEPHLLGAFRQVAIAERTAQQTRVILSQVLDHSVGPAVPAEKKPQVEVALNRLHLLHLRYATYSANPGRPVRFLKNLLADGGPEKVPDETEVVAAFARETGLPLVLLDDQVPLDLEATREWFAQRVIGQPEAVARVLDLLALTKARLARPRKPLASLLFSGPTGTGKTEMAKALAAFLFGDASRMVRFDLNEFSDPMAVQRLIGGPGTGGAEGLLTARVREQPFSVLLLDEFEKADPSFFDLLLQILGDGRLTDAAGRVADFCNSAIVMTSNLGAQGFQRGPTGFRADWATTLDAQTHFTAAVQQFLRPEIFNRLDAVVPFQPLAPEIVLAIARRQLEMAFQRDGLRLRPVELVVDPAVAQHLAARGYDARYGARPLKRALERELLVPLAEALNEYAANLPVRVEVSVQDGALRIQASARAEALTAATRAEEQTQAALVAEIVSRRRRMGRLMKSSAVRGLENEVTMLSALERRLARADRKAATPNPRLSPLTKMRDCLTAVRQLAESANALEDEALAAIYARKALERAAFAEPLDALNTELRQRQREVFLFDQSPSRDVKLACYSDPHDMLIFWAKAFRNLAFANGTGTVVALVAFLLPPGGRSKAAPLVRREIVKLDEFWQYPPEKMVGLLMQVRGDFVPQRLEGEMGLHKIVEGDICQTCLIESVTVRLSEYEPPDGIERKGQLAARGAPLCRSFDRNKCEVSDAQLGKRRWLTGDVGMTITELNEERLDRAIEAETS